MRPFHAVAPSAAVAALAVLLAGSGAACGSGRPARGSESAESATAEGALSETAPAEPEGAPGPSGSAGEGGEAGAFPAVSAPSGTAPAPGEPNRREVMLFFQRHDDDMLGPEPRKILLTDSITDQAKQIVSELIAGPREDGLLPTIPKRTTVLGIYMDRRGTAYLDLSEEFVALHPGGSAEELATIFSIVDSLTYNLPEIKRVRFLVAGEERDSLKSHLDLRRAYLKNMSIVRMEDGA
jgi:hypothetical protein